MYLDFFRGLGIVLALVAFTAICLWAYSSKRREAFSEAANLPFADETNANAVERDHQSAREEKTA